MLNRWIQEAESHPDQHQPEPEQRRHTEKIIENSKGDVPFFFILCIYSFSDSKYYFFKFIIFECIIKLMLLNPNKMKC